MVDLVHVFTRGVACVNGLRGKGVHTHDGNEEGRFCAWTAYGCVILRTDCMNRLHTDDGFWQRTAQGERMLRLDCKQKVDFFE